MVDNATIAKTPEPPYYSVIFTSRLVDGDQSGYDGMAIQMLSLAAEQDGFLGFESARDALDIGLTVSYWRDLDSIRKWHNVAEHRQAQQLGLSKWYQCFRVRICRVEREYGFTRTAKR